MLRWDDELERRLYAPYHPYLDRPRRNGAGWLPVDPAHRLIVLVALLIIVAANVMALAGLH